jgi:acyl dehydratase
MALGQELIGTHYRYPDYFVVGRDKIREFALAAKDHHPEHFDEAAAAAAGHPNLVAPLTFVAVAGRRVQEEIFKQFDLPINMARVFHRDQKLLFHRPILAGDALHFDAYLDALSEMQGIVVAELRSEVTDSTGEPVLTTIVTLIGEARDDDDADATVAAIASRRTDA